MSSRRLASGVAVVLLLASVPAVADDPSTELDQVRSQIDSLESQIDESRAESRAVGVELRGAQESLGAVQAELAEAQGRVDAVAARIAGEEARLADLNAQLESVEAALLETTLDLQSTLADLELQAVEMYMNATSSLSTMMLGFDSAAEASVGLAYVEEVTGESEDLLDTFSFLKAEEERQQNLVLEHRSEVETVIIDLEDDKAALEEDVAAVEALRLEAQAELAEVEGLLASINAEIAAFEQHQESLEADAARLEQEIAALQERGGTNPGVLGWPVSGRVSSPYGYRIHPIFGTRKLHTGIDLSAASGTPIAAAGSGKVILSGPFGGYGNAVVVDHGGGLTTLYAHQSRIAVGTGDRVARGDTIGYVGCTGYCTGAHLHFETAEYGTRVDPMKYLGS